MIAPSSPHSAVDAMLDLRPLSAAIGVELTGVDLSLPLVKAQATECRRALEEHCVLLVRRQALSGGQQLRLAQHFGRLGVSSSGGPPAIVYVGTQPGTDGRPGILPTGPVDFHSDQSYLEIPSIATMLYAIDIPNEGGGTLFSNCFRAFDALPDSLKQQLHGRSALHVYDYASDPTRRPSALPPNAKCAVHPILKFHPTTGRTSLYVSRLMTWSIVGLPEAESREMLEFLFAHQEKPEFVYEHRWQSSDLVIWDNRSCNHARTDFDDRQPRNLRRVTILDDAVPRPPSLTRAGSEA